MGMSSQHFYRRNTPAIASITGMDISRETARKYTTYRLLKKCKQLMGRQFYARNPYDKKQAEAWRAQLPSRVRKWIHRQVSTIRELGEEFDELNGRLSDEDKARLAKTNPLDPEAKHPYRRFLWATIKELASWALDEVHQDIAALSCICAVSCSDPDESSDDEEEEQGQEQKAKGKEEEEEGEVEEEEEQEEEEEEDSEGKGQDAPRRSPARASRGTPPQSPVSGRKRKQPEPSSSPSTGSAGTSSQIARGQEVQAQQQPQQQAEQPQQKRRLITVSVPPGVTAVEVRVNFEEE